MKRHDKITHMRGVAAFISAFILFSLACGASSLQAAGTPQAPAAGTLLFQDDFAQPITGWDRLQVAEGIMDYDGGGYRILVNSPQTNFWATPHKDFSDVRIEVDSGKLGGPDENRIGIVCRLSAGQYYFFLISSDGYYGMGLYKGGQAVLLGQNAMQANPNVKTGLAVNHLRADCSGSTLTFYVNGFQIAQVQDSSLSSGDVGVLAGTFGQPGVDVVFDNFVVLQP